MMAGPLSAAVAEPADGALSDVITAVIPQVYLLNEAAVLLGISPKTARRMIAEDRFPVPAFKLGARWFVRRHELDAFLQGT